MLVYWALFAFFAAGSLVARPQFAARGFGPLALAFGAVVIALLIGFRYEIGADWETYQFVFSFAAYDDLWSQLQLGEPGYQLLNFVVRRSGIEIWLVNLVCGAIFTWGLHRFCKVQPDPWLAYAVAIPYLVIVVGMGYTRQAVALGLLMAGLAAFQRGSSVFRFAAYAAAAALFHKTAVAVLPLVIFATKRNRGLNFIAGIAISILFYDLFLSNSIDAYVQNYVVQRYSSQGAAIRVAMNLLAAVLMLTVGKRLRFPIQEERVWRGFSYAALALLVFLLLSPSSTAVDRLALYIIPLQIAVLPRLIMLFRNELSGKLIVVGYAAAIQFTWLNFASHAEYWVPYQFFPLFG